MLDRLENVVQHQVGSGDERALWVRRIVRQVRCLTEQGEKG